MSNKVSFKKLNKSRKNRGRKLRENISKTIQKGIKEGSILAAAEIHTPSEIPMDTQYWNVNNHSSGGIFNELEWGIKVDKLESIFNGCSTSYLNVKRSVYEVNELESHIKSQVLKSVGHFVEFVNTDKYTIQEYSGSHFGLCESPNYMKIHSGGDKWMLVEKADIIEADWVNDHSFDDISWYSIFPDHAWLLEDSNFWQKLNSDLSNEECGYSIQMAMLWWITHDTEFLWEEPDCEENALAYIQENGCGYGPVICSLVETIFFNVDYENTPLANYPALLSGILGGLPGIWLEEEYFNLPGFNGELPNGFNSLFNLSFSPMGQIINFINTLDSENPPTLNILGNILSNLADITDFLTKKIIEILRIGDILSTDFTDMMSIQENFPLKNIIKLLGLNSEIADLLEILIPFVLNILENGQVAMINNLDLDNQDNTKGKLFSILNPNGFGATSTVGLTSTVRPQVMYDSFVALRPTILEQVFQKFLPNRLPLQLLSEFKPSVFDLMGPTEKADMFMGLMEALPDQDYSTYYTMAKDNEKLPTAFAYLETEPSKDFFMRMYPTSLMSSALGDLLEYLPLILGEDSNLTTGIEIFIRILDLLPPGNPIKDFFIQIDYGASQFLDGLDSVTSNIRRELISLNQSFTGLRIIVENLGQTDSEFYETLFKVIADIIPKVIENVTDNDPYTYPVSNFQENINSDDLLKLLNQLKYIYRKEDLVSISQFGSPPFSGYNFQNDLLQYLKEKILGFSSADIYAGSKIMSNKIWTKPEDLSIAEWDEFENKTIEFIDNNPTFPAAQWLYRAYNGSIIKDCNHTQTISPKDLTRDIPVSQGSSSKILGAATVFLLNEDNTFKEEIKKGYDLEKNSTYSWKKTSDLWTLPLRKEIFEGARIRTTANIYGVEEHSLTFDSWGGDVYSSMSGFQTYTYPNNKPPTINTAFTFRTNLFPFIYFIWEIVKNNYSLPSKGLDGKPDADFYIPEFLSGDILESLFDQLKGQTNLSKNNLKELVKGQSAPDLPKEMKTIINEYFEDILNTDDIYSDDRLYNTLIFPYGEDIQSLIGGGDVIRTQSKRDTLSFLQGMQKTIGFLQKPPGELPTLFDINFADIWTIETTIPDSNVQLSYNNEYDTNDFWDPAIGMMVLPSFPSKDFDGSTWYEFIYYITYIQSQNHFGETFKYYGHEGKIVSIDQYFIKSEFQQLISVIAQIKLLLRQLNNESTREAFLEKYDDYDDETLDILDNLYGSTFDGDDDTFTLSKIKNKFKEAEITGTKLSKLFEDLINYLYSMDLAQKKEAYLNLAHQEASLGGWTTDVDPWTVDIHSFEWKETHLALHTYWVATYFWSSFSSRLTDLVNNNFDVYEALSQHNSDYSVQMIKATLSDTKSGEELNVGITGTSSYARTKAYGFYDLGIDFVGHTLQYYYDKQEIMGSNENTFENYLNTFHQNIVKEYEGVNSATLNPNDGYHFYNVSTSKKIFPTVVEKIGGLTGYFGQDGLIPDSISDGRYNYENSQLNSLGFPKSNSDFWGGGRAMSSRLSSALLLKTFRTAVDEKKIYIDEFFQILAPRKQWDTELNKEIDSSNLVSETQFYVLPPPFSTPRIGWSPLGELNTDTKNLDKIDILQWGNFFSGRNSILVEGWAKNSDEGTEILDESKVNGIIVSQAFADLFGYWFTQPLFVFLEYLNRTLGDSIQQSEMAQSTQPDTDAELEEIEILIGTEAIGDSLFSPPRTNQTVTGWGTQIDDSDPDNVINRENTINNFDTDNDIQNGSFLPPMSGLDWSEDFDFGGFILRRSFLTEYRYGNIANPPQITRDNILSSLSSRVDSEVVEYRKYNLISSTLYDEDSSQTLYKYDDVTVSDNIIYAVFTSDQTINNNTKLYIEVSHNNLKYNNETLVSIKFNILVPLEKLDTYINLLSTNALQNTLLKNRVNNQP